MFNSRNKFGTIYNTKDDIIYAIVTGNLIKVKQLVDQHNINDIIDSKNNYTALHYAITLPNNDIIKYLLDNGGNPMKLQGESIDCFELSLRFHKKYIFDYFKEKQEEKIKKLEINEKISNVKIKNLETTNTFLENCIDKYNEKIDTFKLEIKNKDADIVKLKRKNEDSEKAFETLLKKIKK